MLTNDKNFFILKDKLLDISFSAVFKPLKNRFKTEETKYTVVLNKNKELNKFLNRNKIFVSNTPKQSITSQYPSLLIPKSGHYENLEDIFRMEKYNRIRVDLFVNPYILAIGCGVYLWQRQTIYNNRKSIPSKTEEEKHLSLSEIYLDDLELKYKLKNHLLERGIYYG